MAKATKKQALGRGLSALLNDPSNDIVSANDMLEAVKSAVPSASLFIACAAVADFRPVKVAEQKIKKGHDINTMTVDMVKNPDILAMVAGTDSAPFTVGFAAETENLIDHARDKLARKGINMIVVNDVSREDIGFASDTNEVTVISNSDAIQIDKCDKQHLARRLVELIAAQLTG